MLKTSLILTVTLLLGFALHANGTNYPTKVETGIQQYDENGGFVSSTNFADGADCNIGLDAHGNVLYAEGSDC